MDRRAASSKSRNALVPLLALGAIGGCASLRGPAAIELVDTPFFAQSAHQCGPAALATVLVASGVNTTPDALAPDVMLPQRRGSLALELTARARQSDRLPYQVDRDASAIVEQLQAGRAVLVLLNLGLKWIPRWHFAVVVGFDRSSSAWVLRSGRIRRSVMRNRVFMHAWNLADRYALVMLRPGELPPRPDSGRLLSLGADFESLGRFAVAERTYDSLATIDPDNSLVWFALGNARLQLGDNAGAGLAYRRALQHDRDNPLYLNNLAHLQMRLGCMTLARASIERAQASATDILLREALSRSAAELEARARDTAGTPASQCHDADITTDPQ
ncbi:MAG: PA2778 family cysteine peptidase [Steroidobacteraceae bacterium]